MCGVVGGVDEEIGRTMWLGQGLVLQRCSANLVTVLCTRRQPSEPDILMTGNKDGIGHFRSESKCFVFAALRRLGHMLVIVS